MLDQLHRLLRQDLHDNPRPLRVPIPIARFLVEYNRLRRGLPDPPLHLPPPDYRQRWCAALVPDYEEWVHYTCMANAHETDEEREQRWARYDERFWKRTDRLHTMATADPHRFDALSARYERRFGSVLDSAIHLLREA